MRVGDDAHGGLLEEGRDLLEVGGRVEAHGARVVGQGAARAAGFEGGDGQHFEGLEGRVAGVVDEHGDVLVVGDGELHQRLRI